jgi:hypothetical protein
VNGPGRRPGRTNRPIGEKKDEHEDRNGGYYHRERWSGSFQRSLTLPDAVDADKVKPKQIAVKSA